LVSCCGAGAGGVGAVLVLVMLNSPMAESHRLTTVVRHVVFVNDRNEQVEAKTSSHLPAGCWQCGGYNDRLFFNEALGSTATTSHLQLCAKCQ
jgi:hypothetical protein